MGLGKSRAVAAALSLAAVLTACTAGVDSANTPGSGASAAARELRLAIGGESADGYDPTLGWGRYGSPLFQSTLLARDADLNIVNDLATKHSVSADGLVWTVDLRGDAQFSDGRPVTADDVAYTFSTASRSGGLTDVTALAKAVAVDKDTVELHLTRPQSTFVNRLVSLGIVPKHAHGKDYARAPIGSGPFTFVQWDEGQQLIVRRNDKYYGPKPAFERVVFSFTGEDATLAAAKAGQLSLAAVPSGLAKTTVNGMRLVPVQSVDNRGIVFPYVADTGRTSKDGLPIGNDVTADQAIRRAVNYAVDRDALVDGVLEGFGSPATGPVDGMPWYEPSSAIRSNDATKAKAVLDSAGWTDSDGDGIRERGGRKASFTLLYPAEDTLRQGLALAVVDMLEPVGVQIVSKGVSWDVIDKRKHADAVLFGWGSHDPTEMYNLYSATQAGTGYWNAGHYANPVVQKNLDAALGATDQNQATRYWKAAQRDANGVGFGPSGDAAWAWLVNLQHTYFVSNCLDLGKPQIEPHGHGWPITAGITGWRWTC
ncbi:extracellular solute-binding protein family 5 [Kribbella flavida DSM 17836]|uniref:Extracellular solute-binding protein family 5 n=1 Tax=Kribbella flavida (strain DSM 17836 / JCM 10339 / NBRC 14399) TaxID=479435 RepID=D2PR78_KRIFD|nr:ABC transporter substrate-binding protein [Kribbella flavida]ADB33026.1 extracellular solute-binding protein family 5 [Kribbella flavida DSM 17836]